MPRDFTRPRPTVIQSPRTGTATATGPSAATAPERKCSFAVGDRVKFKEEKMPYTVQAVSASGRYLACTKPFAARQTVIYTVVDLVAGVRGVDDSLGNSLGYETREECEDALEQFESGAFGFSHRKRPIAAIFQQVTAKQRERV